MVYDLTYGCEDSEGRSDNSESSAALLTAFLGPPTALVNRSKHVDSDTKVACSRPSSSSANVSVVITKSNGRPKSQSSSGDQKSPSPGHHGLSSFFAIDDDQVKSNYRKRKTSTGKPFEIPRTTRRYIPPLAEISSTKQRLEHLYEKKLNRIRGPAVTIESRKGALNFDFNFEFVNTYKLKDGIELQDPEFMAGCDCYDCTSHCDSCQSWIPNGDDDGEISIVPYQRGRRVPWVLRPEIIEAHSATIRECNDHCACIANSTCRKYVVHGGRQVRLNIFETRDRGFGVKCLDPVEKGQFIGTYVGELIRRTTSDDREEALNTTIFSSYLFSLDHYYPDNKDDRDILSVDGRRFGSVTRFINHSCNPNSRIFTVSHMDDQNIYSVAFFAIRDIPENTELTIDYQPNLGLDPNQKRDQLPSSGVSKCLCREPNCRGQLWMAR